MDEAPASRRNDLAYLALLLLLAAGVRIWLLTHTEVLARDSIDFIRCAMRLEHEPWAEVLRTTDQMPGYPLLILGMSKIVRAVSTAPLVDAMALSAQLVSVVCGLLTVVPIYLTGRRLFSSRAGFLAALLFQMFPVCVRVTADGLSEGAFFFFASWALFAGASALARPAVWRCVVCGAFSGIAYLTRPEGLEIIVAVTAVAIGAGAALRLWLTPARALAGLACGVLPFAGAYVAATGQLTRKPTSMKLIEGEPAAPAVVAGPPLAMFWDESVNAGESRTLWAAGAVLRESARSSHYYGLGLAVVGVWLIRRRLQTEAGPWLLLAIAGMHALILWRMAMAVGYVSERHTMMLALVAAFGAGAAVDEAASFVYGCLLASPSSPPVYPRRLRRFMPTERGTTRRVCGSPSMPAKVMRLSTRSPGRITTPGVSFARGGRRQRSDTCNTWCWSSQRMSTGA